MDAAEIEALIKEAFKDVKLDGGVSLHQAKVMDNYGAGLTTKEFYALPKSEITDDWMALSSEELNNHPYLSHMDAKGFRYYIPAFMIAEVRGESWTEVLFHLTPEKGGFWEHYMMHYSLLNEQQRQAIAKFLQWIPYIHIELDQLEPWIERDAEKALKNYWHQYL